MATRPVPVRTILATIGLVLATYVVLELVVQARRVLIWAVIAVFLAVSLHPAVEALQRRVPRCRRSVATLLVFLAAAAASALCSPCSSSPWPRREAGSPVVCPR
ncbi:hypothetical protein [Streptomyces sp. NPDC054783]